MATNQSPSSNWRDDFRNAIRRGELSDPSVAATPAGEATPISYTPILYTPSSSTNQTTITPQPTRSLPVTPRYLRERADPGAYTEWPILNAAKLALSKANQRAKDGFKRSKNDRSQRYLHLQHNAPPLRFRFPLTTSPLSKRGAEYVGNVDEYSSMNDVMNLDDRRYGSGYLKSAIHGINMVALMLPDHCITTRTASKVLKEITHSMNSVASWQRGSILIGNTLEQLHESTDIIEAVVSTLDGSVPIDVVVQRLKRARSIIEAVVLESTGTHDTNSEGEAKQP